MGWRHLLVGEMESEGPGTIPVRSRQEIYGLSSNDADQQEQADDGTLLAARTVMVVGEVMEAQMGRCGSSRRSARSCGFKYLRLTPP